MERTYFGFGWWSIFMWTMCSNLYKSRLLMKGGDNEKKQRLHQWNCDPERIHIDRSLADNNNENAWTGMAISLWWGGRKNLMLRVPKPEISNQQQLEKQFFNSNCVWKAIVCNYYENCRLTKWKTHSYPVDFGWVWFGNATINNNYNWFIICILSTTMGSKIGGKKYQQNRLKY